MKRLALASAALFALCPVAWSQTPPDEEAPQVDEGKTDKGAKVDCFPIMQKADQAMGKLEKLSFKAHSNGVGGVAFRNPEVKATVRMVRTAEAGPGESKEDAYARRRQQRKEAFEWSFDMQGTTRAISAPEPKRLAAWYDGEKVHSVREADKQVVESAWDESDEALNDGAVWVLTWAARWKSMVTGPFAQSDGAPSTRHEGEAVIEGVPCDVVYVDYSESSDPTLFDAWWYIAKSDSLPRRLDMHFIDNSGKGDGFSITTLYDLKTDQAFDKAALAMKLPEGYEIKTVVPPERKVARGGAGAPPKPSGPQVGAAAPDWTLKDAAGKDHTLSAYKGKVVVLDFWATWCGPCKAAMPGIQAIHDKYKGKGVAVFGVNCWESGDAVKYMKDQKFTYGLLLKADDVAGKYGVSGIPTIYVIGGDGKVLYQSTGFAGEEAVEAAIERGLKP